MLSLFEDGGHTVVLLLHEFRGAHVVTAPLSVVSVTFEPVLNEAVHVVPQLMPAGCDVTVPEPEPARDTVSDDVGTVVKFASTAVFELSVNVHVKPLPLQPPPVQPVNVAPQVPGVPWITQLWPIKIS